MNVVNPSPAIIESYSYEKLERVKYMYESHYLPAVEKFFPDQLDVFIEVGVFEGDVSLYYSELFREVHGIEIDEKLCEKLEKRFLLQTKNNIKLHKGDSRDLLHKILEKVKEPALFWLDAHYAGPSTGGDPNYVPILEELKAIRDWKQQCIVVMDDVNKFGQLLNQPAYPLSGYLAHRADWTHINTQKIYDENNHYFNHSYWADEKRLVFIKND